MSTSSFIFLFNRENVKYVNVVGFVREERRSMSQVVFGELLALLLNCSAEIFVDRLLELQTIAKIWSSSELPRFDTEIANCDSEHTTKSQRIADIELSIKPECMESDVTGTLVNNCLI